MRIWCLPPGRNLHSVKNFIYGCFLQWEWMRMGRKRWKQKCPYLLSFPSSLLENVCFPSSQFCALQLQKSCVTSSKYTARGSLNFKVCVLCGLSGLFVITQQVRSCHLGVFYKLWSSVMGAERNMLIHKWPTWVPLGISWPVLLVKAIVAIAGEANGD